MIEKLLEQGLTLKPEGQRILSITAFRDRAIIVTDSNIYEVRPEPFAELGFLVYLLMTF